MKKVILSTIALIALSGAAFAATAQAAACCCKECPKDGSCVCCCECGK